MSFTEFHAPTEKDIVDAYDEGTISKEEAQTLLRKGNLLPPAPTKAGQALNTVLGAVQDFAGPIGVGAAHGLADIAGSAGNVVNLAGDVIAAQTGERPPYLPKVGMGTNDIRDIVSKYTGITLPGKENMSPEQKVAYEMARAGTSFLPQNWRQLVTGSAAGAAGELASNALGQEGITRPAAEGATMLLAALQGLRRPRDVKALQGPLKEAVDEGRPGWLTDVLNEATLRPTGKETLEAANRNWLTDFFKSPFLLNPTRSAAKRVDAAGMEALKAKVAAMADPSNPMGSQKLADIYNYSHKADVASKISRALLMLQGGAQQR